MPEAFGLGLSAGEIGFGLSCLPQPSPGDIFLDFEGDPYVDEGGIEYLLGYVVSENGEPIRAIRCIGSPGPAAA